MTHSLAVRLYQTPVESLPDDLYIPPEAFAVWLEQFEGPLDFLLYLVKKNNFDITTTALLPITEQYLTYIGELDESHFELAGDYLLMASTLVAIKSELLLPNAKVESDSDNNPTKKLIRRLEEYAQIKSAAQRIDTLLRLERDVFLAMASMPDADVMAKEIPPYSASILIDSLIKMHIRPIAQSHHIHADSVPLSERMTHISRILASQGKAKFFEILDKSQGKLGVVVSFVAVLELAKQRIIEFSLTHESDELTMSSLELIWMG